MPCCAVSIPLDEYEALKKDRDRLDYLERAHTALNALSGTNYGWKLIINQNVVRFMAAHSYPRDGFDGIDLHDSQAGNEKKSTCREAIDLYLHNAKCAGTDASEKTL